MKKIFLIATLALVILSSNLFARKPKVELYRYGGQIVSTALLDYPYIGYDIVRQTESGMLWWKEYDVHCVGSGEQPCSLTAGGNIYYFTISDINNDDITYDFNEMLMIELSNKIFEEIELGIIEGKREGKGILSKKYLLEDKTGRVHNVVFSAEYNLDKEGNGKINMFINTFNI